MPNETGLTHAAKKNLAARQKGKKGQAGKDMLTVYLWAARQVKQAEQNK